MEINLSYFILIIKRMDCVEIETNLQIKIMFLH
jgi:hypothetical protein